MLKTLGIDYYANGYRGIHANCIDVPIAGAAGYHNYNNYFYYLFYYCMNNNWASSKKYNWISFREDIFNKLGLRLRFCEVASPSKFISSIQGNIDNKCPIVMIVKYCTLFFLNLYLTDSKSSHAIIINEYDSDRKIVVIRERLLNSKVTEGVMRGDPFFKLQLTEDLILDIWLKTNNLYRESNNIFYNKLLGIEKISEPIILSYNLNFPI
jgi:hypothetical protein